MIVETLTKVDPAAGVLLAYGKEQPPLPVAVRAGVPECWFVHACYEQLSSTNATVNTGGRMTVRWTGAVGNDLPIRIGDVMRYNTTQAAVLQVSVSGGTTDVLLDAPFASGTNQTVWVSYVNRRDRLTAATLATSLVSYNPLIIGQVRNVGSVADGGVTTCYYVNARTFAQGQFLRPSKPVMDDVVNTNTGNKIGYGGVEIEASMALIAGSPVNQPMRVTNATAPEPAGGYISNLVNGSLLVPTWCEAGVGQVVPPTYERDAGTYLGSAIDSPTTPWPTGSRRLYVCWYNRYGAPQVLPFSWLNQEGLAVQVQDIQRQAYATRNLGTRATETLTLTTGLVSNRFREWFEDLAMSPWIYVAHPEDVAFQAVEGSFTQPSATVVNVDNTQWTEYRIMPATYQLASASTDLINLTFELTAVEERVTYRN